MSDISSKVVDIIVDKLGVDAAEVVPTASFTNDLGADSLDTVELIMEFEKEMCIRDSRIGDDQRVQPHHSQTTFLYSGDHRAHAPVAAADEYGRDDLGSPLH